MNIHRTTTHRQLKRFWLVGLLALAVSVVGPSPAAINAAHGSTTAQHPTTLADLPQAAQALVSKTLGHEDSAYYFQTTAAGYRAASASNTLKAEFSNTGMRLSIADSQWNFSLRGLGYGDILQAVSAVAPNADGNRLAYARDTFTEWYVNGPGGLEQGWTLNARPAAIHSEQRAVQSKNDEMLTLALAVNGQVRLNADGRSLALLNADGSTVLNYTGLSAYDATGKALRAWLELRAGGEVNEVAIHVDDTDAQYPLTIDPWLQQAELTVSGGTADDDLGTAVAISGDGSTIVAGAPGVSTGKGAAYVFVKSESWATTNTPTAILTNSGGANGDALGTAVTVNSDGSVIVAGAYGVSATKGAAYVFVRPGEGWATTGTPTAILTNFGGVNDDHLGDAVSISDDGSTIVAGAPKVSTYTGAAYVFVKPGGGWATTNTPTATLTNSSGANYDQMGNTVAISGDGSTIAVGAFAAPGASGKGVVYVFVKSGSWTTTGTPSATLTNSVGANNDQLGYAVAINSDGSTIVAGAPGVASNSGATFVFVKPGGGGRRPAHPPQR